MKARKTQGIMAGVAVSVCMLLMVTISDATEVVVGGDSANIGTIIFVSPSPGDSAQTNGTALLNALAGLTADVNNPYLIKLGPGIYDVSPSGLQMDQYVSIEGSGEKATKITASVNGTSGSAGTVMGADNTELRFLTVENTGTGSFTTAIRNLSSSPSLINVTAAASGGTRAYGVFNSSGSSTVMTNVTATASGGTSFNIGVINAAASPTMTNVTATSSGGTSSYGVNNSFGSSPAMTNVLATASGAANNMGVANDSSSPVMINVIARGLGSISFGVHNVASGTVKINQSVLTGALNAVYNGTGVITRIGNTQLDGGTVSNSGTLTCAGVYDEDYIFYSNTCP